MMYPSKIGVPIVIETQEYAEKVYPKLNTTTSQIAANDITSMTMMTLKKDEDKALVVGFDLSDASFPTENSSGKDEDEEEKRGKSHR